MNEILSHALPIGENAGNVVHELKCIRSSFIDICQYKPPANVGGGYGADSRITFNERKE